LQDAAGQAAGGGNVHVCGVHPGYNDVSMQKAEAAIEAACGTAVAAAIVVAM